MIEKTKSLGELIYSTLPKLLGLTGLLLFYTLLCEEISKSSTEDEISKILRFQTSNNANQVESLKTIEKLYHCLTEEQFNTLMKPSNVVFGSYTNYIDISLNSINVDLLKKYIDKHSLPIPILLENDSINKNKFLENCISSFKLDVDEIFKTNLNKFNKENISSIEIPIIKSSLPKSLIPNILIILIIIQLLKLLLGLYNLVKIINAEGYFSKDLKDTILIYKNYYSPSLEKLINLYYLVLILIILIILALAFKGSLFYHSAYPANNIFSMSHYFLSWLNILIIICVDIWVLRKLTFFSREIKKFN